MYKVKKLKPSGRREFEKTIKERFPLWGIVKRESNGGYKPSWLDGAWIGWCMHTAFKGAERG